MASIFPADGVAPGAGVPNAYVPVNKPSGCPALYFAEDCTTVLTTETMNSFISEFLAIVDKLNIAWNCASVTNVADALVQEFETIRAAIEAVQGDLATLAGRVGDLETDVADLVDDIATINITLGDLDTRITALGDRIDNLTAGQIKLDPQIGDYINVQQALAGLISGDYTQPAAVVISDVPPANPKPGMLWWSSVNGELLLWYDDGDSSQWVAATDTGQGIKDAPYDGKAYARQDGEWVEVEDGGGGGGGGIPEAPQDGSLYGRQNAGWAKVPDAPPAQVSVLEDQVYLIDGTDSTQRLVEEWGYFDGADPLDGQVAFQTVFSGPPTVSLTMQGAPDAYTIQSITVGEVAFDHFTFFRRTFSYGAGVQDMVSNGFGFWYRALGRVAG